VCSIICAGTLWGQPGPMPPAGAALRASDQSTGVVRGELSADTPLIGNRLVLELFNTQTGQVVQRVNPGADGSFQLGPVPVGQYQLRVADLYGNVVEQQFVDVHDEIRHVFVTLPDAKKERPVSGTVSVAQLTHKISRKALKEFAKAQEAARAGDDAKSIRCLLRAIAIDPEYMEAYSNLGSRYFKMHELDKALEAFRRACDLDPDSPIVLNNLAMALYSAHDYGQAEEIAQHLLRLEPGSATGALIVGLCIRERKGDLQQALDCLNRASGRFPIARIYAAELLKAQGKLDEAAQQLQSYLNSGETQNREQVQTWLAGLERRSR
jgi:Tfp pilus assembly protein PilF